MARLSELRGCGVTEKSESEGEEWQAEIAESGREKKKLKIEVFQERL